jgi:uncharacterized phage protein gp47/JayE
MPYFRPSLSTLIERAIADIDSRLPGADARVRRSNLNVLARVNAGAAHGLYGYLAWLARQILPDTADAEILDRHAAIWLPSGRLPAAYATGSITLSGTPGTLIPPWTVFKRADGAAFFTDVEARIGVAPPSVTLAVTAELAGPDGNTEAGRTLTLDAPRIGLAAQATVDADGIGGGAAIESDDCLRTRLIARIQNPPMGGSAADYVTWGLEVPGVTRVWVYPLAQGAGTVVVRFVRDNDADRIPDAGEVAAVQAHINAARPVTADVWVVAPVPFPVDFIIHLVPNTPSVRAAVEAELRDLLRREAEPEGGNHEGRILISHVREAISLAAGEIDHTLVSPLENIAPPLGQIAVFGSITWV